MTTSIWEDFGVDTAVITPDENAQSDHEQEMLKLDVPARSGDDSFETSGITDSEGLSAAMEGSTDPLGEQHEDSVRIDTETGKETEADTETEGTESEVEDVEIATESPELSTAVQALQEHTEGFSAMVDKALNDGDIDAETFERIQEEYASDEGLSDASYEALAAKGYSRQFVNAFIQGQDSLTQAYAQQVVNYVGGQDNFNSTYAWLEANNPALKDMLHDAIEDMKIGNVKAIFDSVKQQRVQRYGQAPQRNLASRSQPQRPKASQPDVQGFASMAEMTKAMSDKRYANDASYRAEVERRVAMM